MENDLLFSRIVKTPDRRYFFDVYEKPTGLLLTIKESRMNDGRSVSQTVYVWESALSEFLMVFLECVQNAGSDTLLEQVRFRLQEKDEKPALTPVTLVGSDGVERVFHIL